MGGKSTTSSSAEPWGPIQPYLKDAASSAADLFNQGGFSADPYAGDRVAGFGDTTNQAFNTMTNLATNGRNYGQKAVRATKNVMNTGRQDLDALTNEALGVAIPAATSMFSNAGLADSTAAQDYVGRAATEAVAPIYYQAENDMLNRKLAAASQLSGLNQGRYDDARVLQSVGTMQDMLLQSNIDAAMAKYYEGQGQDAANLQGFASLINPMATMGGTSESTTSTSPGFGEILGTGLQLFGLFSDRRTKENIRHLGTHNGHNVYTFNYLWSPTIEVGVMADEVPHAICGNVGGYAVVDYARL